MEQTISQGGVGALIAPKEVRKLLGKESEGMTDGDLMRIVRRMSYLSATLIEHFKFHKNLNEGVK